MSAFGAVIDRKRIYHASFAIGFDRPRPNISEVTVFSKEVSIGSLCREPAAAAAPLSDAVRLGGIPCQIPPKKSGKSCGQNYYITVR